MSFGATNYSLMQIFLIDLRTQARIFSSWLPCCLTPTRMLVCSQISVLPLIIQDSLKDQKMEKIRNVIVYNWFFIRLNAPFGNDLSKWHEKIHYIIDVNKKDIKVSLWLRCTGTIWSISYKSWTVVRDFYWPELGQSQVTSLIWVKWRSKGYFKRYYEWHCPIKRHRMRLACYSDVDDIIVILFHSQWISWESVQ